MPSTHSTVYSRVLHKATIYCVVSNRRYTIPFLLAYIIAY
nr:MAG TPA: hypothetical protein [Caudoviricetes sp.]